MLNKLSRITGITPVELRVVIFIVAVFCSSFILQNIYSYTPPVLKEFDYSKEDSIFNSIKIDPFEEETIDPKTSDKNIDYKQEVLDFNKPNFEQKKSLPIPLEKSLNLNLIGTEELEAIPGIGKAVAQRIVDHRLKIGKYKNLEELLDIKGIGETKFNKIKKYLYIE